MNDKDLNEINAENISWELFKKTGNINYYLLHQHIVESDNNYLKK